MPPIGFGVVNNDGSQQTIKVDQPINRQSEFSIIVKNTGNVPDNFIITSNSTVNSKWKVGIFDIGGKDYTKEVYNGGWLLSALRPGESVKLFLRIVTYSGQVIDVNNPPTQTINTTAYSRNDIAKNAATLASDTVTATAVLTKVSGIK
ncbi:MAG: hypothetical protein WCO98_04215 [bacterium]